MRFHVKAHETFEINIHNLSLNKENLKNYILNLHVSTKTWSIINITDKKSIMLARSENIIK